MYKILSIFALLFISMKIWAGVINGPSTVCVAQNYAYVYTPPQTGYTYVWTAPGNTVLSQNGNMASIGFSNAGSAQVNVSVYNASNVLVETVQLPVTVSAMPAPVITASIAVDCDRYKEPHNVPDNCLKACNDNLVVYQVNAQAGNSYQWTVSGGTIQGSSTGNSVTVLWGQVNNNALITLTQTNAAGCSTTVTQCIQVVESPTANVAFNYAPNAAGVITLCKNQTLSYVDQSSDAFFFEVNFGNGTVSTLPAGSIQYNTPGTYSLTYKIENECGCYDVLNYTVEVLDELPLEIVCLSTTCEGRTLKYSSPSGCGAGSLSWQVSANGTITQTSPNGDEIEVFWANGDIGTITLTANCPGWCSIPYSVQVPIIDGNTNIVGNTAIVNGASSTFTLPAWPGTHYSWTVSNGGIINAPASGIGINQVMVDWDVNNQGPDFIEVTYYNAFLKCGGTKRVDLFTCDTVSITAEKIYCSAYPIAANSSNNLSYNWQILNSVSAVIYSENNTSGIAPSLNLAPGLYTIKMLPLAGSTCNAVYFHPFTVLPSPPTPNAQNILTNDTVFVCSGGSFNFTGFPTSPDNFLYWYSNGNTTPISFSGNAVTFTFNGNGPWTIKVKEEAKEFPHCASMPYTILVMNKSNQTPSFYGSQNVCNNASYIYGSNAFADVYEWSIDPVHAGSITSGQGNKDISILWNNYVGNATIKLKRFNCQNNPSFENYAVTITAGPSASIVSANSVCLNSGLSFTATAPGFTINSYAWQFNNPNASSNAANPTHVFTSPGSSLVTLTLTTAQCNASLQISKTILVHNLPVAVISSPETCLGSGSATMYSSVNSPTGNSGFTYQWQEDNGGGFTNIPGATTSSYTTSTIGVYYRVQITDNNTGCITFSNQLSFGNCTPPTGCTPATGASVTLPIPAINCMSATFLPTVTMGRVLSFTIRFGAAAPMPVLPSSNAPLTYQYTHAEVGYYTATVTARLPKLGVPNDSCDIPATQTYLITPKPSFTPAYTCPGGTPQVAFASTSQWAVLPITTYQWSLNGTAIAGATNYAYTMPNPSPGGFTIGLSISDGNQTCSTSQNISIPAQAQASFTGPSQSCEKVPVIFTNTSTGNIIGNHWNFSGGATLIAFQGTREFSTDQNEQDFLVTLTVTDVYGCSDTETQWIQIYNNELDAFVQVLNNGVCFGNLVNLNASILLGTPNAYLWTTGSTLQTATASQTGDYFVQLFDANGCSAKKGPGNVKVIQLPDPIISGKANLCEGETVQLSAYMGNAFQYDWQISNVGTFHTPMIALSALAPGTYTATLTLSDPVSACSKTAAPFVFTVHPNPAAPVVQIAQPACPDQMQVLSVQSPITNHVYNWNNGQYGSTINIYSGGNYSVTVTDPIGCKATGSINILSKPDLSSFMSGCYEICNSAEIPGIAGTFAEWTWWVDGSPYSTGTGLVPSLQMTVGVYEIQLEVKIGNCSYFTETLSLHVKECAACEIELLPKAICLEKGELYYVKIPYTYQGNLPANYHFLLPTGVSTQAVQSATINSATGIIEFYLQVPPGTASPLCFQMQINSGEQTCIQDVCINLPRCSDTPPCSINSSLINGNLYCYGFDVNGLPLYGLSISLGSSINPITYYAYPLNFAVMGMGQGIINSVAQDLSYSPITLGNNDSLVCIRFYLSTLNSMCYYDLCLPVPDCIVDPCAAITNQLAITCLGYDAQNNPIYGFTANAYNPEWQALGLQIQVLNGDLLSSNTQSVGAGGNTSLSGTFTTREDGVCLVFTYFYNGAWCKDTLCANLPSCSDLAPCDMGVELQINCEGLDAQGRPIYTISGYLANGGNQGRWFITADDGSITAYSPNYLQGGISQGVSFTFVHNQQNNPVCFDFYILDNEGRICHHQICLEMPGCGNARWAANADNQEAAATKAKPSCSLYPNPSKSSSLFTWQMPETAPSRLICSDASGKVAAEWNIAGSSGSITLNSQPLAPGMYYLRLMQGPSTLQIIKWVVLPE